MEMASAPAGVTVPRTGDPLHRMHVTRPKSAKGRTRTAPQGFSTNAEEYTYSTSPPAPRVPTSPRILQEEVPELVHQVLSRPPSSSLNRYRVLPSIGAVRNQENADEEQMARDISSMRLAREHHERHAKSLQEHSAGRMAETGPSQKPQTREDISPIPVNAQGVSPFTMKRQGISPFPVNLLEPSENEPRLLLAIRSHTGQRFERYFRPTDTMYVVLAVAEEKTGMSCRNCSVESMEVPRRRFADLSCTLQQCGIPNKSVLCIHQTERD
ncbi:UBX domain-containing protein 10 [Pelobates fuscus]|uniref:UBX domain-containing protein 10 n=1 Tax=Pelobates fuscus TaxID=191477 RepID=UPI002FE4D38C